MKRNNHFFIKNINLFYKIALIACFMLTMVYVAKSDANGKTGKTSTTSGGCSCHTNQSSSVTLSATSSKNWKVAPGAKDTIIIKVAHATLPAAGIDIGIKTTLTGETNIGTMAPFLSDTKLSGGEITQTNTKNMYLGSINFVFVWTAPTTVGTYYLRAIGLAVDKDGGKSGDLFNWLDVVQITVANPPTLSIIAPIGNENWCQGSTQNIKWNATNLSKVKIELSNDDGATYSKVLVDSTDAATGSWSWNIPIDQSEGNQFRIRVSDPSNSTLKSISTSSFIILPKTSIITHPLNKTLCKGDNLSLMVSAAGTGVTYQWRHNGINIQGEANPTFLKNTVTPVDSGTYDCIVSGNCGTPITSNLSKVIVNVAPEIIKNPISGAFCEGEKIVLITEATGSNILYQWQKNGQKITNAKTNTYTIESFSAKDEALYDCIVTGSCYPQATCQSSDLTLKPKTEVLTQPKTQDLYENTLLELSITANGSFLKYQWRKDGVDLKNATKDKYTVLKAASGDAGSYDCKLTADCGILISDKAIITIKSGSTNPILSVTSTDIIFDHRLTNTGSVKILPGFIKNIGVNPLTITAINITGKNANSFQYVGIALPLVLNTNESTILSIKFNPLDTGSNVAKITFISNSTNNPEISLSGIGDYVLLNTNIQALNFNALKINDLVEKTLSLTNNGNIDGNLTLSIKGTNAAKFSITSPSSPFNLASKASKDIVIKYNADKFYKIEASLSITYDGSADEILVNLVGNLTDVEDNNPISSFNIYPNPSSDYLDIKLSMIDIETADLTIYNNVGSLVYDFGKLVLNKGDNTIRWNGSNIFGQKTPSGTYDLRVKSTKMLKNYRFVIAR